MVWKKVINSDSGTADQFGGNDIDKISDAFNGVNVSDPIIYNTDQNTLKDSTINQAGDLLKNNATKYVRWAKGTALQVPRVNAAGTDLEWHTPVTGGGPDVLPLGFNHIIYKTGATYYAKNGITGAVDFSGSDARTVIQAAVDVLSPTTGGTILIAAGTYPLNDAIGIAKSNTTIIGEGGKGGKRTLLQIAANNKTAISLGDGTNTFSNVSVKGVAIDMGNFVTNIDATHWGLRARKINNLNMEDVYIYNQGANTNYIYTGSTWFTDCLGGNIYNCLIEGTVNGLLLGLGTKYYTISNNIIRNITWYDGIVPFQSLGWHTIVNNVCYNIAGSGTGGTSVSCGINLDGGSNRATEGNDHSVIVGNTCFNCKVGIQSYLSNWSTISGNSCFGNNTHGIYVLQCGDYNINVNGNTCKGNIQDGINVYQTRGLNVSNNVCESNARDGIRIQQDCYYGVISGNYIAHSQNHGLKLDTVVYHMNINGNTFYQNGKATHNTYDDIHLTGQCQSNLISGNKFITHDLAVSGNNTILTRYGYNEITSGTNANNYIHGNFFGTHATADLSSMTAGSTQVANV